MITLIPMAKNVKERKGEFTLLKSSATLYADKALSEVCEVFPAVLGFVPQRAEEKAGISIFYSDAEAEEGYSLSVDENAIVIYAKTVCGAFYALQTLRQLSKADESKGEKLSVGFVEIRNDKPKYSWRGLQLDESRHFFGKETVKKLLDFMAMLKLNVFHWHLTDDQGWRIEIKKYPLLTEIGSKRTESQLKNWNCCETDGKPHEGFYTQEDIREIVAYAKKLCINIVPEIDFPAHCAAAIAAYHHLACRDIPCQVPYYFGGLIPTKQGIKDWNRTLCLGKEEVYRFVYDVIDEVAALFPFEYFHIGGDEAPEEEWKKCPLCQEKIKKEKLSGEVELQGYFTNKVNEHLKKCGKTLIGWNEVLKAKGLDRDVVAQYWTPQSDKNVTKHLKEGGKVILSCHKMFYFDMTHMYVTPKNTYYFEPTKHNVPKEVLPQVLGVEGENWTEWTDCEDELFFKLSVRTCALSENAWSEKQVLDYKSFVERLAAKKGAFEALGIYCGDDRLTLHKARLYKRRQAAKISRSLKDFDVEYEIDKKIKG